MKGIVEELSCFSECIGNLGGRNESLKNVL